MNSTQAIRTVRDFLGLGSEHDASFRVPAEDCEVKREYCVSIDLKTGAISRYRYQKDDLAVVPKRMQAAYSAKWVHSYVSWEHAEQIAKEKFAEFWASESATSYYATPRYCETKWPGDDLLAHLLYCEVTDRTWSTARDKETIRDAA